MMESLNARLWNALSYTVGTGEDIFIKRRAFQLNDTTSKALYHETKLLPILSGSQVEGLSLPGSDIDRMLIREDISVLPSNSVNDDSCDIVMETDNIKPGFVRLQCKDGLRNSLLFRDILVSELKETIPNAFAHGPCASYTNQRNTEFDVLECFSSKSWPDITSEWIHRPGPNNWPSQTLIKDIIDGGCLVVPIGDPNSEHNFMEWRISFLVPEKKLIYSMNHTQFLCYALLKLYLKHVINSNREVESLLCSYFLKTSLFYCIEEEQIPWSNENLFDCFLVCLGRLIYWVRGGYCPNFFIKENNMFQGKIYGEKQRILLSYLTELYHDGVTRLRAIPCLSNLFEGSIQSLVPSEMGCDLHLAVFSFPTCCSALAFTNKSDCFMTMAIITQTLHQTVSNVDRAILTLFLNTTMMVSVQWLYNQTLNHRSNKTRYKEIQKLKRYIIQNCMNRDECTGKLLLATLCYLNGEYKEVVKMVEEVLRVDSRYMTMLYNPAVYIDEICGKALTIHQKAKLGLFRNLVIFHPPCGFYPPEVRPELICHAEEAGIEIPTIIYLHLLLFLSHHHLRCKQKVNNALSELYIALQSKLYDDSYEPLVMSILDKCLHIAETQQQNYV